MMLPPPPEDPDTEPYKPAGAPGETFFTVTVRVAVVLLPAASVAV